MNWEAVKGFCRRQSQSLGEKYRGVRSTRDDAVEQQLTTVTSYRTFAKSLSDRLSRIAHNVEDTVACLEAIKEEARMVVSGDGSEMADISKRVEMLCLDLRVKCAQLNDATKQQTEYLRQYVGECSKMDVLQADRKQKLLEYDFFVNKVSDLRRNPPSDPSRIPRNECRVAEWTQLYEDANERCKLLTVTLLQNGSRLARGALSMAVVELPRVWEESARSTRVMFPGGIGAGTPPPPYPSGGSQAAAPPPPVNPYATMSTAPVAGAPPASAAVQSPVAAASAAVTPQPTPAATPSPAAAPSQDSSANFSATANPSASASRRRFVAKDTDDPFKV